MKQQQKYRRNEVMSVLRFFYDITFHPNLNGLERVGAIVMTSIFSFAFVISLSKILHLGVF